jgi:hypothetical protein
MENLARYIILASFSQERMQYLDQERKVVYTSKDGGANRIFPRPGVAGRLPCARTYRTGVSRWCSNMDSATLSETTVQLAILTSISNRKLRIGRWRQ